MFNRIPPPKFEAEHAAIDDLVAKGEITPEQGARRKRALQRDSLAFIARTNGGYRPKRKGRRKQVSLTDQRDQYLAQKAREFAEQAEKQIEAAMGETESDPPQEDPGDEQETSPEEAPS